MEDFGIFSEDERSWGYLFSIIENSDDAIIGKDLDGIIKSWNRGAERIYGYTANEANGQPVSILVPEDLPDEIPAIMERLRRGERVEHYETVRQAKDGRRIDISLSVSPIVDREGKIVGALATGRDITGRKEAEKALYESEQQFRAIFEAATVGITQVEFESRRFLRVNKKFCSITGYSESELLDMTVDDLSHPDDRDSDLRHYRRFQRHKGNYEIEKRYVRKDGSIVWVRSNAMMVNDVHGRPQWSSTVVEEITDRKRAEEELESLFLRQGGRAAELHAVMDLVPAIVFLAHDPECRYVSGSRALCELLGLPFGKNLSFTPPGGGRPPPCRLFRDGMELPIEQFPSRRAARGEEIHGEEWEVRFDDGRIAYWLGDAVPLRNGKGEVRGALAAMVDITEIKRSQEQLETRANQQAVVASFGQRALTGSELQPLYDEAVRLVTKTLSNEMCKVLRLLPGDKEVQMEAGTGWKDGLVGKARVPTGLDSQAGYTLESKEPVVVKDLRRETRFSGPPLLHEHGVVSGISVVIPGERGRPWGVLGAHTRRRCDYSQDDVNFVQAIATILATAIQRKNAELRLQQLNDTLEHRVAERTAEARQRADQLQRLAGELTRVEHRERRRVARLLHDDLQQILVAAKIRLNANRGTDGDDGTDQMLAQAIDTSRSLSIELAPPVLYELGLNAALKWLSRWVRDKYGLTIELVIDRSEPIESESLRVLVFEALRELLLNVVKHANVDEARVSLQRSERRLSITVEDFGTGFDPTATHVNACESGFGLISIRERLELIDGTVRIESAPGKGTTVEIAVPLDPSSQAVAEEPANKFEPKPPESAEDSSCPAETESATTVLLVDDHDVVRQGLVSLISLQPDMRVVAEAASGEEAVDLALRHSPDVVVMDVSLPGISGIEATRRIIAGLPKTCIIGLSMHAESDVGEALRSVGAKTYFNKNRAARELVQAIRGFVSSGSVKLGDAQNSPPA